MTKSGMALDNDGVVLCVAGGACFAAVATADQGAPLGTGVNTIPPLSGALEMKDFSFEVIANRHLNFVPFVRTPRNCTLKARRFRCSCSVTAR